LYIWYNNNNIFLIELLRRLSELMYVKHLQNQMILDKDSIKSSCHYEGCVLSIKKGISNYSFLLF
jgi:hypothetical protein